MLRHAEDDFDALLTASGMTQAGGEVFSITSNGPARPKGGFGFAPQMEDYHRPQKFIVWARVRDNAHIDDCDKAIGKCRYDQKPDR